MRAVLPLVPIIGRPNVGKSTVFNRLIGPRRAIVSDEPGITRDRICGSLDWNGVSFEVAEPDGIVPGEESEIPQKIFEQAEVAIEASSLLLFVVDSRAGRTPVDGKRTSLLRRAERPVFLLVNKIDSGEQAADIVPNCPVGIQKGVCVSCGAWSWIYPATR